MIVRIGYSNVITDKTPQNGLSIENRLEIKLIKYVKLSIFIILFKLSLYAHIPVYEFVYPNPHSSFSFFPIFFQSFPLMSLSLLRHLL